MPSISEKIHIQPMYFHMNRNNNHTNSALLYICMYVPFPACASFLYCKPQRPLEVTYIWHTMKYILLLLFRPWKAQKGRKVLYCWNVHMGSRFHAYIYYYYHRRDFIAFWDHLYNMYVSSVLFWVEYLKILQLLTQMIMGYKSRKQSAIKGRFIYKWLKNKITLG